jgi:hypothetical protein
MHVVWDMEKLDLGGQELVIHLLPKPTLEKPLNRAESNWRRGSSSKMPASQAQSLEFKPQAHQK